MIKTDKILLGHGSGGKLSHELIHELFRKHFRNDFLDKQTDSAVLPLDSELVSFTTDSFVVDPIFFPGGDIGKLAICGTVNDLAVSGAVPPVPCLIRDPVPAVRSIPPAERCTRLWIQRRCDCS